MMEPQRRCAIKGLLELRQQMGHVHGMHSRDSVIRWLKRRPSPKHTWTKCLTKSGRLINVMSVSPADFDLLKAEYVRNHPRPDTAPQQQRLSFPTDPTPSNVSQATPVTTEAASMCEVKKSFTNVRDNVLAMADAVSQEARPISVEDILKSQKLTSLNPSKVGAKATQLFKKRWPGRQLAKRPRLATNGVPIEENAWTEPERELLEAAAWYVYISEQPSFL